MAIEDIPLETPAVYDSLADDLHANDSSLADDLHVNDSFLADSSLPPCQSRFLPINKLHNLDQADAVVACVLATLGIPMASSLLEAAR